MDPRQLSAASSRSSASPALPPHPRSLPSVVRSMSVSLEGLVDQIVSVVTCDGRVLVGFLRGFDQTVNLVLDECHERVYSKDAPVEQVILGLYIVRGDNV